MVSSGDVGREPDGLDYLVRLEIDAHELRPVGDRGPELRRAGVEQPQASGRIDDHALDRDQAVGRALLVNGRRLAVLFLGFAALGYLVIELIPTHVLVDYLGQNSIWSVPLAARGGDDSIDDDGAEFLWMLTYEPEASR